MAQYIGAIKGSRLRELKMIGHKSTGLTTKCNGWNLGVTCEARYDENTGLDVIDIYKTNGSSRNGHKTLINTITEGE